MKALLLIALLAASPITETKAVHGYEIRSATSTTTPDGVRFHGFVCRTASAPAPTRLVVQRRGADGDTQFLQAALRGFGVRSNRCIVYDAEARWTLTASDRISISAQR